MIYLAWFESLLAHTPEMVKSVRTLKCKAGLIFSALQEVTDFARQSTLGNCWAILVSASAGCRHICKGHFTLELQSAFWKGLGQAVEKQTQKVFDRIK